MRLCPPQILNDVSVRFPRRYQSCILECVSDAESQKGEDVGMVQFYPNLHFANESLNMSDTLEGYPQAGSPPDSQTHRCHTNVRNIVV